LIFSKEVNVINISLTTERLSKIDIVQENVWIEDSSNDISVEVEGTSDWCIVIYEVAVVW